MSTTLTIMNHIQAGLNAESKVRESLQRLPAPWVFFDTVEWRTLYRNEEQIGEADFVVFHPHFGVVVLEVKSGEVRIENGRWFYQGGQEMKQSPFAQARRNRYALIDKLKGRLGADQVDKFTVTHGAWFPDVYWKGSLPTADAPTRSFLLDRSSLDRPEDALRRLLGEAAPSPVAWTKQQQHVLKEVLAPDCHMLVPLVVRIEDTVTELHKATDSQIRAMRMLRTQKRLLVESKAGSGKTLLAVALAKDHAAMGKQVLLTCFNKHLAKHLAACVADQPNIKVANFHEFVRETVLAAGMEYVVPQGMDQMRQFFGQQSASLLFEASDVCTQRFDTVIVDEAADFHPDWWTALECYGADEFSWYCFYDKGQQIFGNEWKPPFAAEPIGLDANLRNPRPIGLFASKISKTPPPDLFLVESGLEPVVMSAPTFEKMADQLREVLRILFRKEMVLPENVVVLAPSRHDNPKSTWSAGLNQVELSTDLSVATPGKVRVGTLQSFKGLEAPVVVFVGVDARSAANLSWLYVGATRAKGMLYLLKLDEVADL